MAKKHAANLLQLANTGQVFENRMLDTLGRVDAEIKFKTSAGDKLLKIAGNSVVLCLANKASATCCAASSPRAPSRRRPPCGPSSA